MGPDLPIGPLPPEMPAADQGGLTAGRRGAKAIDEIAARKESFEWGAFLRVTSPEAPPADMPNESVPAASAPDHQVLQPVVNPSSVLACPCATVPREMDHCRG